MEINQAIQAFLDQCRLANLENGTISTYRDSLYFWRNWRKKHELPDDISAIQNQELKDFFTYCLYTHVPHQDNSHRPPAKQRGLAVNSVRTIWRNMRTFWNYTFKQTACPFSDGTIPYPSARDKIRDVYDDESIEKLLNSCDNGDPEETHRNRAIILLLAESGMRISELCSIEDKHVNRRNKEAQIVGKGSKVRYVWWGPRAAVELEHYLKLRRGPKQGMLLRGVGSRNRGDAITPNLVRGMVRRLAARAGVTLPGNAPLHAFRHYFARKALDAGVNPFDLKDMLGHRTIKTTEEYVKGHPGKLRNSHARIWAR